MFRNSLPFALYLKIYTKAEAWRNWKCTHILQLNNLRETLFFFVREQEEEYKVLSLFCRNLCQTLMFKGNNTRLVRVWKIRSTLPDITQHSAYISHCFHLDHLAVSHRTTHSLHPLMSLKGTLE